MVRYIAMIDDSLKSTDIKPLQYLEQKQKNIFRFFSYSHTFPLDGIREFMCPSKCLEWPGRAVKLGHKVFYFSSPFFFPLETIIISILACLYVLQLLH